MKWLKIEITPKVFKMHIMAHIFQEYYRKLLKFKNEKRIDDFEFEWTKKDGIIFYITAPEEKLKIKKRDLKKSLGLKAMALMSGLKINISLVNRK